MEDAGLAAKACLSGVALGCDSAGQSPLGGCRPDAKFWMKALSSAPLVSRETPAARYPSSDQVMDIGAVLHRHLSGSLISSTAKRERGREDFHG